MKETSGNGVNVAKTVGTWLYIYIILYTVFPIGIQVITFSEREVFDCYRFAGSRYLQRRYHWISSPKGIPFGMKYAGSDGVGLVAFSVFTDGHLEDLEDLRACRPRFRTARSRFAEEPPTESILIRLWGDGTTQKQQNRLAERSTAPGERSSRGHDPQPCRSEPGYLS